MNSYNLYVKKHQLFTTDLTDEGFYFGLGHIIHSWWDELQTFFHQMNEMNEKLGENGPMGW